MSKINEHIAAGGKFNLGQIKYILKNDTTKKDNTTLTTSNSPANTSTQTPLQTTTTRAEVSNTQGFGKELANLAKMYTEDNKYSGENDNFDFKLVIFHNLCNRADIH